MIINKSFFFNPNTVNIFTDASIKKVHTGETIACPGCEIVLTDENGLTESVYKSDYFIRNATNNIGELCAILLGLNSLTLFPEFEKKKINLFSDSQLCINSIREWIFSWINNQYNNIWYGSSGDPVKNQEIIKQIIQFIYKYNVNINFYHQKGHVTNTQKSIENAIRVFNNSNGLVTDFNTMQILSHYNNSVDIFTKQSLDISNDRGQFNQPYPQLERAIISTLKDVDFDIYKNLINRKE